MRAALAAAAAVLLAGCASSAVTLLKGGEGATGAVAVFDPATGEEVGALTQADTRARLGGGAFRAEPARPGAFDELMAYVPPPPRVYVLYFHEGGTELTAESRPILDALRAAVTAESDVQITGHTDTVGALEDNDALSLRRAAQVRDLLVEAGLPFADAKVTGRGEREPRVKSADGVAEPANRRVEVTLR